MPEQQKRLPIWLYQDLFFGVDGLSIPPSPTLNLLSLFFSFLLFLSLFLALALPLPLRFRFGHLSLSALSHCWTISPSFRSSKRLSEKIYHSAALVRPSENVQSLSDGSRMKWSQPMGWLRISLSFTWPICIKPKCLSGARTVCDRPLLELFLIHKVGPEAWLCFGSFEQR